MTKKENGTEEISPWELTDLPVAPPGAAPAAADLQKIIRKHYREPILEDDPVCAEINGHTHRVSDIGSRGLGLIVPSRDGFLADASCSVTLHIGDNTITLSGRITHVSPSENTGEFHCGIEFINLSQNDEQALQRFLTEHHARLFSRTSRSADLGRD
jgi:hypothetical protein